MSKKENSASQKICKLEEKIRDDKIYGKHLFDLFERKGLDVKGLHAKYPEWFNDLDIVNYLNSCTYDSISWKEGNSKVISDKEAFLRNAKGEILFTEKKGDCDDILKKAEVYKIVGLMSKFMYVQALSPEILSNKEFVLKNLLGILSAHKFDRSFLGDVDFLQKVENWNITVDGVPLYNQVPFEVKKNPLILNRWMESFNILYNPLGIPFELQLGSIKDKIQGVYKFNNSEPITKEELKKNPSHIMTLSKEMRSDYHLMVSLASTGIEIYAFCNPDLKRNRRFLREVLMANQQLLQIDNYQPGSNYGCIKNLFSDADVNFEVEDDLFFELIDVLISHEKNKNPDALIDCWVNNSKTLLRNHTFREKIMAKYGDELLHDRDEVTEIEEKIAVILKEMLISYEEEKMKKTVLETGDNNLVKKMVNKF